MFFDLIYIQFVSLPLWKVSEWKVKKLVDYHAHNVNTGINDSPVPLTHDPFLPSTAERQGEM